ncbi:MAG: hypothetical protein L0H53_12340 [Candidatus Nitrosocosmicus sp.]|nr:hypothetical protein [Candidatus Nitrosocosmicus sp.]
MSALFSLSESNIVSAVINVGDPDPRQISPYTKIEGVPQIVIKNDNITYQGALRVFTLVTGDVNDNMPAIDSNSNISSILPENAINVSKNEQIQLLISGNPQPELQPSSLSSTVYFTNGSAFKVLSITDSAKRDTFLVDVPIGKYVLLAAATWLPNPDNYLTTSGYVTYTFRLNVQ